MQTTPVCTALVQQASIQLQSNRKCVHLYHVTLQQLLLLLQVALRAILLRPRSVRALVLTAPAVLNPLDARFSMGRDNGARYVYSHDNNHYDVF
jgi:hypothetical protein